MADRPWDYVNDEKVPETREELLVLVKERVALDFDYAQSFVRRDEIDELLFYSGALEKYLTEEN